MFLSGSPGVTRGERLVAHEVEIETDLDRLAACLGVHFGVHKWRDRHDLVRAARSCVEIFTHNGSHYSWW